jgi:uncharacterized protein (DUF1800 family)
MFGIRVSRLSVGRIIGVVLLLLGVSGCSSSGKATDKSLRATSGANDVARFLEQATFGPTPQDIQHLQEDLGGDYSAWLDEQLGMPVSDFPDVCCSGTIAGTVCNPVIACAGFPVDVNAYPQTRPASCAGNCQRDNYTMWQLQQLFYTYALTAPDQLRQRVFFALNQILVTSGADDDLNYESRMTGYLRFLEENAFGNFRDILYNLSRNPTMGRYLDNITNTADEPNENYAREIMQLFSIGLVVLNPDGTSDGTATYTQDTVVELTKALSGWVLADPLGHYHQGTVDEDILNFRDPLVPDDSRHDTGTKTLFAGTDFEQVIPAGQTTEEDLNSAIDILFNHPNTGTFIGKALIQMLVTSNPSGDYMTRVTQAFNDNGSGIRGDMTAVIKAILLDSEARNPSSSDFGKLREPVLAVTNLLRNFNSYTGTPPITTTDYALSDFALTNPAGTPTTYLVQSQDVLRSPTVFNFFPPDFQVPGEMPGFVGPEFGILSTTTALSRMNLAYQLIFNGLSRQATYRPNGTMLNVTSLLPFADDVDALVEACNQILLHGAMADDLRSAVTDAVSSATSADQRVKEAVFLVSTSPAFQVQR